MISQTNLWNCLSSGTFNDRQALAEVFHLTFVQSPRERMSGCYKLLYMDNESLYNSLHTWDSKVMLYDRAHRHGEQTCLSLRAKVSPIYGERVLSRDPYKSKDPHIADFLERLSRK